MARTSKAPDGWITLYAVARDYLLSRNTELVEDLCRPRRLAYRLLPALPVRRFDGVACMRIRDLEEWLGRLEEHADRPGTYRRRARRGALPPSLRLRRKGARRRR